MSGGSDTTFVPLDYPICGLMMRDAQDAARYHSAKCCVDCWVVFVEPLRKLKRDEEYLPTDSEIESYRSKTTSHTETGEEKC